MIHFWSEGFTFGAWNKNGIKREKSDIFGGKTGILLFLGVSSVYAPLNIKI